MRTKQFLAISALTLGLGLTLGLCLLVALQAAPPTAHAWPATPMPSPQPPVTRPPGPAFVKPGGTGAWCLQSAPCGSIQYAIDQSTLGNGDTIYVAGGVYTGAGVAVITITKPITLYGGWDGAASGPIARDPARYPTVLDGENSRRAVAIHFPAPIVLDGLILQRGNAAGLGGDLTAPGVDVGGALYAYGAFLTVSRCDILSSSAGFGGGVALYKGALTMTHSLVRGNIASQTLPGPPPDVKGAGGGILAYHSQVTLVDNAILSNTSRSGGLYGGGGGLYLDNSPGLVQGNVISDNYSYSKGGGIFLYQSAVTLRANLVQGNASVGDGGGAFMIESAADWQANTILGNESSRGGGVAVFGCPSFTMTNNAFVLNRTGAGGIGPALLVSGLAYVTESHGALVHNTFTQNESPSYPWMIHLGYGSGTTATLALTNTIIDKPGGFFVQIESAVTLETTLWDIAIPQPNWAMGPGSVVSHTNYHSPTGLIPLTFRLGPGSAAIDRGVPTGVTSDIEGQRRPLDGDGDGILAADIGADERGFSVYLPLAARTAVRASSPASAPPGDEAGRMP